MLEVREPRRGAIIGFGSVAEKGHLPGWQVCPGVEIVAVADPSPERRRVAARLLPHAALYAGYDELFACEQPSFVDIVSPPAFHRDAIVAAARHRTHVLCEKPLAISLDDYQPARLAVEAANVVLHTVHNWKYSEAFGLLADAVCAGTIGELEHIGFEVERNGWSMSEDDWRIRRAVSGGGILIDHGWHSFYLVLALAGRDPLAVSATLEKRRYISAEIEDTARCTIDFAGLVAEIHLTWAAPRRRTRWLVRGTRGRVVVDEEVVIIEATAGRQERRLSQGLSVGSHHPEWFPAVIDSFWREIEDPAARGANRREAERCLTLLDRAYASAAAGGQWLAVP